MGKEYRNTDVNIAAIRTTRVSGYQRRIWQPQWQLQQRSGLLPGGVEEALAADLEVVSVEDAPVEAELPEDGDYSLRKRNAEF